jgi:integrase
LRKGNARTTIDNNLIALRSLFNWAVSKEWIAANPAAQSRVGERLFFDAESVRKPTYTREECERIIAGATGDAQRVFILLASWGLRISELAMLEWTDLDFRDGWVNIRRKVTHDGLEYAPKDKEDRRLPLEGEPVHAALDYFAAQTGRRGYVVPLKTRSRRQALAERRFLNILKDIGERTQVDPIKLTLHNFRHYFVSECADRGVPMAIVMDWVGHADMKMVMYYYRLRDTTARDAMRRFLGDEATPTRASDDPRSPSDSPDDKHPPRHPRRQKLSERDPNRHATRRAPRRTAR